MIWCLIWTATACNCCSLHQMQHRRSRGARPRRSWALAERRQEEQRSRGADTAQEILGAGDPGRRGYPGRWPSTSAGEESSHGWRSAGQDWRRDGRGSGARWAARCWPAIWGEPQFQFPGKTTLGSDSN